jgi:steroid delta-isomerase-like uncharacterized protein
MEKDAAMPPDNADIARRWFEEVWNQRRADTIDELLTEGSVCHRDASELRGPAAFKTQVHEPFLAAFPDLHIQIEAILSQEDDVVVRWLATGTHAGPGLGLPAAGRPIRFRGITWIRTSGGKLLEGFDCWDVGGLMVMLQS